MMEYKSGLIEAGQALKARIIETDPQNSDIPLIDAHLVSLQVEVDQLKAIDESQRAQVLFQQTLEEFKSKPLTSELTTVYWQSRWGVKGAVVGLQVMVPDCKEYGYDKDVIEELANLEIPRKPIYVPDQLETTPEGLVMLGKMHPLMRCWATSEGTTVKNTDHQGGWFDIESDWRTPYTRTSQTDLENIAKDNHWKGQRLATYIVGSEDCYDLTGHYFDENGWVRLLGSQDEGRVVFAGFLQGGKLFVDWDWLRDDVDVRLGGRFEGVKKA